MAIVPATSTRLLVVAGLLVAGALPGSLFSISVAHAQRSDTTVRAIGAPVHAGVATLVEEMSIGAASGSPEVTFSAVSEVAVGGDGSVFVLDRPGGGTPFLRQYNASGRFVRTIGRSGDGPGEYRNPSGLAVHADGRILLRDAANHRLNVYSPRGELVDTWRLAESGTSIGPNMVVVDTGGTIWVRLNLSSPDPSLVARRSGLLRFSAAGAIIDTVHPPEFPPPDPPPLVAQRGGGTSSMRVPYTPEPSFVLSPHGWFVTGLSNRYAIELRVPPRRAGVPVWRPGDPVISLRRERIAAVPVTDAERAARREFIEANLRRTDPSWRWPGADIPRLKPAYTSFRLAADGRIWVLTSQPSERFDPEAEPTAPAPMSIGGGRAGTGGAVGGGSRLGSVPAVPWRSPAVYDIIEPDGRYIGQVRIPYGVVLRFMRGDHVWATTTDEDGVPYVKRYRIMWR